MCLLLLIIAKNGSEVNTCTHTHQQTLCLLVCMCAHVLVCVAERNLQYQQSHIGLMNSEFMVTLSHIVVVLLVILRL